MAKSRSLFTNLRFKITLYILIGALVFSGIVIVVTSISLNKTLATSYVSQSTIIASSIGKLMAPEMIGVEIDDMGIRKTLEDFRQYLNSGSIQNEYILVADPEHEVVAYITATNQDVVIEGFKEEHESGNCAFCRFLETGEFYENEKQGKALPPIRTINSGEVYDIRIPIEEGMIGYVAIGLKKSFVDQKVQTTLVYIGIIIAVGALAALVVALAIITVQVTRPVIKLANAAEEISLGNFDTPIDIKVKNELQILAAAIDRMKESLKTSLDRLKTRSTIGRF
jgi:HAMP domain-containing protein